MTRARSNMVLGCVLAASWLLASCSQDAGESCQTSNDCGSGLICCGAGKSSAERSYCGYAKDEACGAGDIVDSGLSDASIGEGTDAMMSSEDGGGDGG